MSEVVFLNLGHPNNGFLNRRFRCQICHPQRQIWVAEVNFPIGSRKFGAARADVHIASGNADTSNDHADTFSIEADSFSANTGTPGVNIEIRNAGVETARHKAGTRDTNFASQAGIAGTRDGKIAIASAKQGAASVGTRTVNGFFVIVPTGRGGWR